MLCQHSPLSARFINSLPGSGKHPTRSELDETLQIAQARQGDAAAYGELVRKYQNRLCTAMRYMGDSFADAEDTTQEAFLRAFMKLHTFNGASTFYTWLYRIAVNLAISKRRRRRLPVSRERNPTESRVEPTDREEGCDERLMRHERAGMVQRALASLCDEYRSIIVLRDIEGFNYDEIALILNVPVGTVRSRLHRARLQLRERLVIKESSKCS